MLEFISHLQQKNDLSPAQVEAAVARLFNDDVNVEQKAEFLRALRMKGETPSEIASFAQVLLSRAVDPAIDPRALPGPMVDICGTGGDKLELFNVSTTAMFVLAAGGAVVVKHGNRGITSRCGGADVLEALGISIHLPPAMLRECLKEHGLGFLFAPDYHASFKSIAPVRKMLAAEGITTIFNLLGPLLNPARPPHQLAGVFSPSLLQKYAETLRLLGRKHAWVVHGSSGAISGGMDEISTIGSTEVCSLLDGEIAAHQFDPHAFGFPRASIEELRGGDCENNARIIEGILQNRIHGAKRDVVIVNAAAAFVVSGLAPDVTAGITLAHEQLESGRAFEKLSVLRNVKSV